MSLVSMTGYGRASMEEKGRQITVEVSSVNRKQLDVQAQLPKVYAALEPKLQELIRKDLQRGRIHVGVSLQERSVSSGAIFVDEKLAKESVRILKRAAKSLGIQDDFSVTDLLKIPEVVKPVRAESEPEAVWNLIQKTIKPALHDLKEMRKKEGALLQKQLEEILKKISAYTRKIETLSPQASIDYEKRLIARLKKSGLKQVLDDERILKEIALFAEKVDVSEEVHRLASHFKQVEASFKQRKPAGRTLDFLAQEMLREMNTIGSKCNNAAITKLVIQSKAELDRFKEQVQNIE